MSNAFSLAVRLSRPVNLRPTIAAAVANMQMIIISSIFILENAPSLLLLVHSASHHMGRLVWHGHLLIA